MDSIANSFLGSEAIFEQEILIRIGSPERTLAKRGSKEAVLKHFGVFQGDDDLEEQLAEIRARREAMGE